MRTLLPLLLVSSTLVLPASAEPFPPLGSSSEAEADIVETAISAGNFRTLVAALEAANLVDALRADGPFTVFAPTDDAFARLPQGAVEQLLRPENRDALIEVLTGHVVSGAATASTALGSGPIETLRGSTVEVRLEGGALRVDEATVVSNDLRTSNGIIHVIDTVLLPVYMRAPQRLDIVETAERAGAFGTLLAAVGAAGLTDVLRSDGPFTVLAPTDEAFARLPEGTVEELLLPGNRDALTRILKHHVIAGEGLAAAVLSAGAVTTLIGERLPVGLAGGRLTIGDASVVKNDVLASNGVIHVIDAVLLPPAAAPSDPLSAVSELLELAVQRGAPIFNRGEPYACAAIYEVALRSIVDRPGDLPASVTDPLRRALAEIELEGDGTSSAWALRRGIDDAVRAILQEQSHRRMSQAQLSPGTALFSFDRPRDAEEWFSLNDDVMGGISTSGMVATGRGTAVFQGALSLENNGGFATVRSRAKDLGLAGKEGLRARVRGDGRVYRMSVLTSDGRMESRIWQTEFRTRAGEWQEISVPFSDMVLSVFGRKLPQAGAPSPASIRSISFGIADKNETPFSLEVDWVEAIGVDPRDTASAPSSL